MKHPVVLVGVGEMGGVFARGLLRLGYPVFPVTRSMHMEELAAKLPDPEMVLIAVAENDLQPVLHQVPVTWRTRNTNAWAAAPRRDWPGRWSTLRAWDWRCLPWATFSVRQAELR